MPPALAFFHLRSPPAFVYANGMTLNRTVALVGMMGAGKTSIGRRLAARLKVPFRDADHEIETAASLSISEIFARFGEPHFRDGERKVIARLLEDAPHVLATGGGAILERLLQEREPVYATADMTLETADEPHGVAVERIIAALKARGLYEDS